MIKNTTFILCILSTSISFSNDYYDAKIKDNRGYTIGYIKKDYNDSYQIKNTKGENQYEIKFSDEEKVNTLYKKKGEIIWNQK